MRCHMETLPTALGPPLQSSLLGFALKWRQGNIVAVFFASEAMMGDLLDHLDSPYNVGSDNTLRACSLY